jgi:acetyl esterase
MGNTILNTSRSAVLYVALLLTLLACSDNRESLDNNDPTKYTLHKDVLWASPGGIPLTMDIYTPTTGAAPYPVLVMFHGGGWLINDKSIMHQSAAYLATHGRYVICNVNYRLLSDNGNTVTLKQSVEDAFGAVLWVQDNISRYRGDSTKIAVTGDSAGGHLSAMVVNLGDRLNSNATAQATIGFTPSYLPAGQTADVIAQRGGISVQAAILNYGAFDIYQASVDGFESLRNIFWLMSGSLPRGILGEGINVADNPDAYQALSPSYNVPDAAKRKLPPQLLTVGSEDTLVTPASVKSYAGKLQAAGQPVEYWEYAGRQHAYLDSGSNLVLGTAFETDAPAALNVMLGFLDAVFYQESPRSDTSG